MLPKEYRLKKRAAFSATYKTGKTLHKDGITVFIGKEKQIETPTKVGFVVSKKIHKRAVKRNRIKRLMREVYRLMLKNGEVDFVQKRLSIIFMGRQGALNSNITCVLPSFLTDKSTRFSLSKVV